MLRKVGLLVFCLAWLLPGLIGHSPWKPDEAYTIDIIQHFAHSRHWIVPQLAGEPFMEKPPLYDWVAVGLAKVFSHWLPFADAARLTSGFFMALALLFTALTAREVFGRRSGWLAVLALIGTVGLAQPAHEAFTDVGLFAGIAAALYGLVLCLRRPRLGGVWLGTGVGVAFLCKGLIGPGLIGVTALVLLCCGRAWRRRHYVKTLLISFACSLPWLLAWPIALYLRSPHLFTQWLWVNNFGRYFGFVYEGGVDSRDYYFQVLPAFTWPILPLAIWTLWSEGRELISLPAFQVPLVFAVVTFGVLEASAVGSNTYALPLLLPLAVLAAGGIDSLPVKMATVCDWIAFVALGLAAVTLWIGWIALVTRRPAAVAAYLNHFQPDYVARPQTLALAIAAACTAAWLLIAAPRPRAPRHVLLSWGRRHYIDLGPWNDDLAAMDRHRQVVPGRRQRAGKCITATLQLYRK